MKAVILAAGLLMAGQACAAAITGSIGVKLVIYSRCEVNSNISDNQKMPQVTCGPQLSAQPKVTASKTVVNNKQEQRLVTVEW